jgi:hypothetical protein
VSDSAVGSVVGNPRPESRTDAIARTLVNAISEELGTEPGPEIELAALGARARRHAAGLVAALRTRHPLELSNQ